MRRVLVALGLAISACGGGAAQRPTAPSPGAVDAFTAVFRAVEQWRQGWEVRSMEALAPLYRHDDHTVVVYQGQAHVGWPAAETYLRSVAEGARAVHLLLDDGQVSALGDSGATYAARLTRDISDGAVTTSDTGYLTLTFARTGDRWEIVAEHYSYRAGP
ncbi:MAG: nuclear transport factor 2 family protein [Kofleriaceae bacterium]